MVLWVVLAVVVVGLLAAWLYDRRVRARRGRIGDVSGSFRSSSAGVTADPEAHRAAIQNRRFEAGPWS